MNQKRYWLRGLIFGVIFGILVTYVHEHIHYSLNFLEPYFGLLIQKLYIISFMPWSFVGILIVVLQFYLPSITYGILGGLIGWLYGKIKNRNKVV